MNKLTKILNKPELLFAVIAFIFGSLMIFLVPPNEVPDEKAHILRSCEVASGIFYNKVPAQKTKYEEKFDNLFIPREENKFHFMSGYSPVMYIASSAGIKIGSSLFEDGKKIIDCGRFANLFLYILFIALSIKITPVFKYPFLFSALLPMSLYEGMSISADSFNIALSFFIFSFVLNLIYKRQDITKKEFSIMSLITIAGAFCKGLIYPAVLYFFIPAKKYKKVLLFSIVIIAFIICGYWKNINHTEIFPDANILCGVKLSFNDFCYMLYKTTIKYWQNYLMGAIGIFGSLSIFLFQKLYFYIFTVFILMFIFLGEKVKLSYKIVSAAAFLIFYIAVNYMMYQVWTTPELEYIAGIQGRYFIPLMPFLFIILGNNKFHFTEREQTLFKLFIIFFVIYIQINTYKILYTYYNFVDFRYIEGILT